MTKNLQSELNKLSLFIQTIQERTGKKPEKIYVSKSLYDNVKKFYFQKNKEDVFFDGVRLVNISGRGRAK